MNPRWIPTRRLRRFAAIVVVLPLLAAGCFENEPATEMDGVDPEHTQDYLPEGHAEVPVREVPRGAAQAPPTQGSDLAPGEIDRRPAGAVQFPAEVPSAEVPAAEVPAGEVPPTDSAD